MRALVITLSICMFFSFFIMDDNELYFYHLYPIKQKEKPNPTIMHNHIFPQNILNMTNPFKYEVEQIQIP